MGAGEAELTAERLRELLSYDPETCEFKWEMKRRARGRAVAGCKHSGGYIMICVDGRIYLAHRLAWLYMYGFWLSPRFQFDHINGCKSDNRRCNLRHATPSQNKANMGKPINNTSGYKGVCFDKGRGKWRADIRTGRGRLFLGNFKTPEAAHAAYAFAAEKHHGGYARVA
jgi:hypothetical protein